METPTNSESHTFSVYEQAQTVPISERSTVSSLLDSIQNTKGEGGGCRQKDDSGRSTRSAEVRKWVSKPDNPGLARLLIAPLLPSPVLQQTTQT